MINYFDKPIGTGEAPTIADDSKTVKQKIIKPPIGIKPRYIHDEQRLIDIQRAIERYLYACMPIPTVWIYEYNELVVKQKEGEQNG